MTNEQLFAGCLILYVVFVVIFCWWRNEPD